MIPPSRSHLYQEKRFSWITAIVLAPALLLITGYSGSVGWVRDPSPVLLLIGFAGILALALSLSRFRPRAAHTIALALSTGSIVLVVGRILPSPESLLARAFSETVWLMNVRLWTFLDDLGRAPALLGSGSFPGVVFATAAYGFLAWQSVHWLVWSGFRRRSPWPAVFLCFGLLLARDALSSWSPGWSMGMTFCLLLAAARGAYNARVDGWERRGLGTSVQLWEQWSASLALTSVTIFFITGLATPQWRDSIDRYLDRFRTSSERSGTRSTSWNPTSPSTLPFTPDAGIVGAPFPKGNTTVLYVTTSDPPPEEDFHGMGRSAGRGRYWRTAIFDRYTGRGWEVADLGEVAASAADPPDAEGTRAILRQGFQILAPRGEALFAANQPIEVIGGPRLHTVAEDDQTLLVRGTEAQYTVVSYVPQVFQEDLATSGTEYPDSIRSAFLELPEEIPQRVRNLATRIVGDAGSSFEKALRIQTYLRDSYVYTEDLALAPPGRDVVDYFLFDTTGGFCTYYASAMVVLLRLEGVPARIVTGFAGGLWGEGEGRYRVPESHAHAWVEVYFPGLGWVEFEPTPSRPTFEYASAATISAARSAPAQTPEIAQRAASPVPWALVLAAAGVIAAILAWRQGGASSGPGSAVHRLYWGMRRSLGREVRADLTPLEFLRLHQARIAPHPRVERAVTLLTSIYIRSAYSAQPISRQDASRARRAWRSAWWDRLRLMLARETDADRGPAKMGPFDISPSLRGQQSS